MVIFGGESFFHPPPVYKVNWPLPNTSHDTNSPMHPQNRNTSHASNNKAQNRRLHHQRVLAQWRSGHVNPVSNPSTGTLASGSIPPPPSYPPPPSTNTSTQSHNVWYRFHVHVLVTLSHCVSNFPVFCAKIITNCSFFWQKKSKSGLKSQLLGFKNCF